MLKIKLIIGSTRPQRFSEKLEPWILEAAKKKGLELEVLDLRDYALPFYNEPVPAGMINGNYSTEVAKQWAAKIGDADGFIITMAEYNHGYTAVLKNAIDYVHAEWFRKPVGYVGYGGAGAISSTEQIRQVLTQLQMMSVPSVHVLEYWNNLDGQGNLKTEPYQKKLEDMIDHLIWWGNALKDAKAKDAPAVSAA
jgi:NAD(P)H-dependent FMN reductase